MIIIRASHSSPHRVHLDDVVDAGVEALLPDEALDVLVAAGRQVAVVQQLLQLPPAQVQETTPELGERTLPYVMDLYAVI